MSLHRTTLPALAAALLVFACSRPAETPPESAESAPPPPPRVEEIPVTTSSQQARAAFEAGRALLDAGRNVEARERFRAAVEADPTFAYGWYNLSNASLSFAEFQEALDQASAHLEGKSEGERLLVEINRTFLTNDSDRGLALARELTEAYPASPRAWLALAGYQGGRNENQAARAAAAEALELDPELVAAHFFLGFNNLFGEPKDFARAEQAARDLTRLGADAAKTQELLGDVKRAQGDLDAALAAYTAAVEADPELAQAQVKKGHVASFLGDVGEARAAYDAAVEHGTPETRATYAMYRAFTHIHGGDVQASLDELWRLAGDVESMGTPADQVQGVQVFILTSHATAALHAGELEQAAEAIAWRNRLQGEIAETVGTEDARRLLDSNRHVFDGLLAAYRGDRAAAAEHAEQAAALVENDPNPRKLEPYHWVLGTAALKAGDYAAAAEHLRQADHVNTMFIRYQLALAEAGLGNVEEARELFREVATWNFNSVGFALVHEDAAARAAA